MTQLDLEITPWSQAVERQLVRPFLNNFSWQVIIQNYDSESTIDQVDEWCYIQWPYDPRLGDPALHNYTQNSLGWGFKNLADAQLLWLTWST